MISVEEVEEILTKNLPGANIQVEDMTGTNDHFQVVVRWEGFQGKSLMDQHRVVHQALASALDDGRIHALKIKTQAKTS